MPKVCIYMPAYNVGKYIAEAVASIKKQTFQDWSLAILDDFSDDNTLEEAEKAQVGDQRIIVAKRDARCGRIGKLKNEAIAMLPQSEYVCHVGSDDLIPPYCLQSFVDLLDAHPHTGAACGTFVAFDDSGKHWMFPHVMNDKGFDSARLLRYMSLYPMRFYSRSVVEEVGGYSNDLTSAVDYDLALKLDEVTNIERIEDRITYYYRQHPTQVSTAARTEQNANAKKALEAALKRRGMSKVVVGDAPPFQLADGSPDHFIWGKKK